MDNRQNPIRVSRFFPLISCLIVSAIYGAANYLSGKYYLPGCSFAELRPQVALPMFMGVLSGPWAGFLCGGMGDMLGYTISGKGVWFAPLWSFANGLMGFIPGLLGYWITGPIRTTRAFGKLLVLLLAASSLPFILPITAEISLGKISFHEALFHLFLPIFITDTLWSFMLVPLMMYRANLMHIHIELRTILLVYYLLIFTVLATWLCHIIITMQDELKVEELYTLGGVTLLVLMIGLLVSAVFARRITSPIIVLTQVAQQVSKGNYDKVSQLLAIAARSDEIGALASVFKGMVKAVENRETELKRQVRELRIEIDHKKQKTELKKITGTDYFKQLKQKAGDLRTTISKQEQGPS